MVVPGLHLVGVSVADVVTDAAVTALLLGTVQSLIGLLQQDTD
jgi:hypothetical protein